MMHRQFCIEANLVPYLIADGLPSLLCYSLSNADSSNPTRLSTYDIAFAPFASCNVRIKNDLRYLSRFAGLSCCHANDHVLGFYQVNKLRRASKNGQCMPLPTHFGMSWARQIRLQGVFHLP